MKITGNTILITGGTSGIGFELASQLIKLGNTVIITGRQQERLDAAKAELPQVHTVKSNATALEDIISLFQQVTEAFPKLNVLINNAGIMRQNNFHDSTTDLEDISLEIETNLIGTIRMVKQFLPHLKRMQNAAIVNVTSGLAFVPMPMSPVYCATKAALHSFTLSLRIQLKRTKVLVFELAPPLTMTPLATGAFDAEDRKGIPIMTVENLTRHAINGFRLNQLEIRPGMSAVLKIIGRIAPNWLLSRMLSPTIDRMLAQNKS